MVAQALRPPVRDLSHGDRSRPVSPWATKSCPPRRDVSGMMHVVRWAPSRRPNRPTSAVGRMAVVRTVEPWQHVCDGWHRPFNPHRLRPEVACGVGGESQRGGACEGAGLRSARDTHDRPKAAALRRRIPRPQSARIAREGCIEYHMGRAARLGRACDADDRLACPLCGDAAGGARDLPLEDSKRLPST